MPEERHANKAPGRINLAETAEQRTRLRRAEFHHQLTPDGNKIKGSSTRIKLLAARRELE